MAYCIALAVLVGQATYYAPGVMDEVVARRLAWGQVNPCEATPGCSGYVATLDCEHIGRSALVWVADSFAGRFTVADCARAQDAPGLAARGWAVDLDWPTARRYGLRAPAPARVFVLDCFPLQPTASEVPT